MALPSLRWILALVLLISTGCSRPVEAPVKKYVIHGEIIRLNPQIPAAVIKHSAIVGWMEAMTMEFPVKDRTEYERLRQGEKIDATVFVQGLDYWIGEVREAR